MIKFERRWRSKFKNYKLRITIWWSNDLSRPLSLMTWRLNLRKKLKNTKTNFNKLMKSCKILQFSMKIHERPLGNDLEISSKRRLKWSQEKFKFKKEVKTTMMKVTSMKWTDPSNRVVQRLRSTFINTGHESSNQPLQVSFKIFLIKSQKQRKLIQRSTKLVRVCSKKS